MPTLCLGHKATFMAAVILSTVSVNLYVFYVELGAFSHLVHRTLVNTNIMIRHLINTKNLSHGWTTGKVITKVQLTEHGLNSADVRTSDPTRVVRCEESSFIECIPPPPTTNEQPTGNSSYVHRTFHVVVLQRPHSLSKSMFNFSACKFSKCCFEGSTVTERTDVVIVHADYLTAKQEPLTTRWKQLYILAIRESAIYALSHFANNASWDWSGQFNWTLTYRQDSNLFVPYKFQFQPKTMDQRLNYYEIAKNKTKTAVWFVSHCNVHSGRHEYVHEMQKDIDVDIFANCGKPCTRNDSQCMGTLSQTYKFYLSFVNSLCTDYATEQIFKLFVPGMHVVPVVRGGPDYDKHFPKYTYINAAQFKTPRELALYLKNLASDLKSYSKYLENKDLYENAGGSSLNAGCALCEFLHTQKPKLYGLYSWASFQRCYNATDAA